MTDRKILTFFTNSWQNYCEVREKVTETEIKTCDQKAQIVLELKTLVLVLVNTKNITKT